MDSGVGILIFLFAMAGVAGGQKKMIHVTKRESTEI